ncbi:hypothetical protein VOLCADRAFT_100836 [Volvox carteri f. nagariensis]|uniref:MYND-type domain-containing protein n=1 Tax=Volvox carteri f. nagariensis TaxID=3068 RepID=D8UL54_VOLCA|nr:uncharacterized protein VOLCADRAFT_100836 [Volvox carteri f. nagariensis]EFJ39547.1 hypothetical protein VOLCADRAFT_100836 [Volvox carteri f. nagariensis]|eukprot:XP_002959391.1 hypothetical protein VOLCADRAFT_100836 [Volvox carteri f. nagariensis]
MACITMDPPHVVNTGVSCAACCNVAPGKLLRCAACDSAWYCNQECQRKHFKEHKALCRALRLFHSLQTPAAAPHATTTEAPPPCNCRPPLPLPPAAAAAALAAAPTAIGAGCVTSIVLPT